ncbi:hypothetical protein [[Eubacterium] cellulosolvens]
MNMAKNIVNEEAKILLVLSRTRGAAPLGYISEHSRVKNPYETLLHLEKKELVSRVPPGIWGLSYLPLFVLTPKARDFIRQATDARIEQLIEVTV